MSNKEVIDVPELGDSTHWSYNQCIRTGDRVSVAGQTGVDEQYNPVSSDFEEQARQAFQNVEYALNAAGGGLEDIGSVETLRELHVRPVISRHEGPPEVTDSPVY